MDVDEAVVGTAVLAICGGCLGYIIRHDWNDALAGVGAGMAAGFFNIYTSIKKR